MTDEILDIVIETNSYYEQEIDKLPTMKWSPVCKGENVSLDWSNNCYGDPSIAQSR